MQNFHLLIAGGTGFIGQALVADRLKRDDNITVVGRSHEKIQRCFGDSVDALTWEQVNTEKLSSFDAIINLAGENIGEKRWNKARKAAIVTSRTTTTQRLANLCADLADAAPRLLNASAIGIYGAHPKALMVNEKTPIKTFPFPDFLSEVGARWEEATTIAKTAGVNVVNLRFGVVLASTGGMLRTLSLPYRLGLGHVIGDGQQKISWVSLTDVIHIIDTIIHDKQLMGPINVVSPHCVTQQEFAKTFAHALHRPCWLRLPDALITLFFRQMGKELLLSDQCIVPEILTQYGYRFLTPTFADCFT